MKTKLCLFALLALMTAARGATNDLSAQLQKGLFEEEANRDLTAAIANYQSLANDFDKDRQIAATAVFRLGECYRKLGKTNEAVVQYQRILKEFSDQQTLVTLSRQNLTGLGGVGASTVAPTSANPIRSEQLRQLEWVKKLQDMPLGDVRQIAPTVLTDATLINLIYQYNQSDLDLIRLRAEHTEQNPEVQKQKVIESALQDKIKERLQGMEKALSMETQMSVATSSADAGTSGGNGAGGNDVQLRLQIERLREQIAGDLTDLQELSKMFLPTNARVLEVKKRIDSENANLVSLIQKLQSSQGTVAEAASPVTDEEQQQIRRIQLMIQNSPDLINAVAPDGITPLQDAAMKGQLSVAKYLLDHGADVNRTGSSGPARETALFKAANNGHKAMVELLISRGADINSFNPLERVVSKNYASVAEVLLEHNAEVNYHGSESRVPLHDAAANGATNLIRLLISHGADVNAVDNAGATPLHQAARAGEIDAAKMLIAAKAPVDAKDKEGSTSLHYAAQSGRANMISLLLDSDASVDATNLNNLTPLQLAVSSRAEEAVRVLLAHKADPNQPVANVKYGSDNVYTSRPIYYAISQTNILKMLLNAGADPDGQLALPTTPLNSALEGQNVDSARLLLEHGANPNQLSFGNSPLAVALREPKNKPVIPLLLEKGADANGKNAAGLAPLFVTTDPEIGAWLIAHKADVNARFTEAQGSRNRPPGVPGVSIGFEGFLSGYTPLMRAVVRAPEFAKFLLENGAKAGLQDTNGNTALHYAAFYARPEGVTVLLEHKANPNIQNDAGYTPLDIAKSGTGGNMEYGMLGGINNHVGTGTSAENEKQIAELLTQAGGLANLPKRNRIEVRRASQPGVAFTKGSRDWNRYSLLEMIAGEYRLLSQSPAGEWGKHGGVRASLWNDCLRFPDFKNVIVYRREDGSPKQKAINVDVEGILSSGDCSRDMRLEWGDVIEIPESDHPVDVAWTGLSAQTVAALTNCLARQVMVTVKGVSTTLKLMPELKVQYFTQGIESRDMLELTYVSFMLRSVLDNSKLVRVSSDLSRVKVTRMDPETKKKQEWVIDCTDANANQADLWLRDGDVVEVPEK